MKGILIFDRKPVFSNAFLTPEGRREKFFLTAAARCAKLQKTVEEEQVRAVTPFQRAAGLVGCGAAGGAEWASEGEPKGSFPA